MKIKVCGLKYQDNIKQLSLLPINYMGFIFYKKSPRFVDDVLDFNFIKNLPKHIKKVGVFVNEPSNSIQNIVAHYNLDVVQLHGDETEVMCEELKPYAKVIKAFRINDTFNFKDIQKYIPYVDYFLFDTETKAFGGSGQQFNWDILKHYQLQTPFFLSGGIDEQSIEKIKQFHHPQLFGIDINSKFEINVAVKDSEKIKTFISTLTNNGSN